ncbi:MAG: ParB/RepB/Spo0J family partition protein [archaeon]|nr:ParB/RepB/Spo0J family partition protein [archaeon]
MARKKIAPEAPTERVDNRLPPPAEASNRPKEVQEILPPGGNVQDLPLSSIDLEDETYRFRVNMRVGDLVESIAKEGQQFPILVRRVPGRDTYQVVSGFRRATAIKQLGWTSLSAVVRNEITDEQAFRISILENEVRKSYSDLDRAYAMLAYKKTGKTNEDIETIFNIGSRQRQRLQKLVEFPKALQDAVDSGAVNSTNAVRLMQHAEKYKLTSAQVQNWLDRIKEVKPSYIELSKMLKEGVEKAAVNKKIEFFVESEKKGQKSLRIRPISIDVSMSPKQREALVADLKRVLEFVEGM